MAQIESSKRGSGTLKRVAQGLYRYTASGVYFAHVRIRGKLFRESLRTTDRKTADFNLAKFRADKSKLDPGAGKTTLRQLCHTFQQTLGYLSESSQTAKRGIIARVLSDWPQGADQQARSIKSSDCETWLGTQAARIGRSHYNAYLQLLKDLLDLAVRDHIISSNPIAHLKYLKRENPIRQTPTWEEFQAIVKDIREQRFNADAKDSADFVEFIGLAGLGQAETAGLRPEDVDFKRWQMTTFRHKTRTGFSVPIYPQLRPLLERVVRSAVEEGREFVFPIKDAKKAITGACKRLKLPAYTHRSFRRMFITRAIEKGIDVKVIAEWQGHRDGGKLILDTYSHVNRLHSLRMAQLMTDTTPENVLALFDREFAG